MRPIESRQGTGRPDGRGPAESRPDGSRPGTGCPDETRPSGARAQRHRERDPGGRGERSAGVDGSPTPRSRRRAAASTARSEAGGIGLVCATVTAAGVVATAAGLLVTAGVSATLATLSAGIVGRGAPVAAAPAVSASALRTGAIALSDRRSVALVALIVALWWPAAIGGAHLVARALAHR